MMTCRSLCFVVVFLIGASACKKSSQSSNQLVRNASGTYVAATTCNDTCSSAGWTCGALCGNDCGSCPSGLSCVAGSCLESIASSCSNCSLKLTLVSTAPLTTSTQNYVLAIDYDPQSNEPHPRVADIRISATTAATLISVVPGPQLEAAGKQIVPNPDTGSLWTLRDGTFQLLIMGFDNVNSLPIGRLATLTFTTSSQPPLPSFSLVKREQTFAPSEADRPLQLIAYDNPVGTVK